MGTSYCRNVLQDDHSSRRAPDTSAPFILPSLHGLIKSTRQKCAEQRARMEADARFTTTQRRSRKASLAHAASCHERSSREQHGRDADHAPPRCLHCPARPFGLEIPACLRGACVPSCERRDRRARPLLRAESLHVSTPAAACSKAAWETTGIARPILLPSGTVRSGDGGGKKGRASSYDRSIDQSPGDSSLPSLLVLSALPILRTAFSERFASNSAATIQ